MTFKTKAVIGPVALSAPTTPLHLVEVDGAVPVTVTYSATPTFNFSLGNLFKLTLTGNAAAVFSNVGTTPRRAMFLIAQDATGGREFTWPAAATNLTPVTRTGNAVTAVEAFFDGTNWYPVAPGNLQLNIDSTTINAGFFAGATNAARVQAAITYAVANGKTIVRIPQSMLPYDASQVTFNPAVRMVREGQGNGDYLDVVAYGANPDNGQGQPGIQAALDTVVELASGGGSRIRCVSVAVPEGRYQLTKPLWVKLSGTNFCGPITSQNGFNFFGGSDLVATYRYGPSILVEDRTAAIPLVSPLATGDGSAFHLTTNEQWFNLRDAETLDVNGLAALTIECFIKIDDTNGLSVVTSGGRFLRQDPTGNAFRLWIQAGGDAGKPQFIVNLSTSGVVNVLAPSALVVGTIYHLAGTYDGTTVRLFVDGALVASSPGSGTIVQSPSEDVIVGFGSDGIGPDGGVTWGAQHCTVDSVRISDTARYTAPFSKPTAKFGNDATTLALMNFDSQVGPMTRVYTRNGDLWAWMRTTAALASYGTTGVRIAGLRLPGNNPNGTSGIFWGVTSHHCTMESIEITNYRYGIYSPMSGYLWSAKNIYLNGGTSRYGFVLSGTFTGIGKADSIRVTSGIVPVMLNGDACQADNLYVNARSETIFSALIRNGAGSLGGPTVLNNPNIDNEGVTAPNYRGSICLGGNTTNTGFLVVNGGYVQNTSNKPCFLVSDAGSVEMNGTNCWRIDAATEICGIVGTSAAMSLIHIRGAKQTATFVPWSLTAGLVVLGHLGKGPAVTFSSAPTFDCSLRDEFEITLTGNCAPSVTNITPGQTIKVTIKQDGTGGHAWTWPSNVKGGGTPSGGGNTVSQQCFTADLSSASAPVLYADAPMVTGM